MVISWNLLYLFNIDKQLTRTYKYIYFFVINTIIYRFLGGQNIVFDINNFVFR